MTAAPAPGDVRVRLVVAYDGAPFHGFAATPGLPTVAGTLEEALARALRRPVSITGAGRTDAGVHAWGQVVSFDAPAGVDLEQLERRVNRQCAPAIVVRDATLAAPDFDARWSASWRRYRYTIDNRRWPDPFLAPTAWHVPEPLPLPLLRLAADPLVGEHDFTSLCRRPKVAEGKQPASLVRRVLQASWHDQGDAGLWFEVTANAFCHQLVRSIVGLLVDVGRGRRRPGDVLAVIRARDRSHAGTVAPPHGLCLREVGYGPEVPLA